MSDNIPMVPKHQAEEALYHMSRAIRAIVIIACVFAAAIVAAIIIFVNGYTSRTKDWLTTYAQLQGRPAVTEVTDGEIFK